MIRRPLILAVAITALFSTSAFAQNLSPKAQYAYDTKQASTRYADDKWDARYNAASGRLSDTGWPLAVVLVATLMLGAGVLIATMARLFDLLYTGGAYG